MKRTRCPRCRGFGQFTWHDELVECGICGGTGWIAVEPEHATP